MTEREETAWRPEDGIPEGRVPVLPLRDLVVFPGMAASLLVGRPRSVASLEETVSKGYPLLLVAQKESEVEDPGAEDVYGVGVLSRVVDLLKMPDGSMKVLVEGVRRVWALDFGEDGGLYSAGVREWEEASGNDETAGALEVAVKKRFETYMERRRRGSSGDSAEVSEAMSRVEGASGVADAAASHMSASLKEKQALLEMTPVEKRLEALLTLMEKELNAMRMEKKIRSRVKKQMEKTHREYMLNEQLKAIQRELNEGEEAGDGDGLGALAQRISKAGLPEHALKRAESELKKLRQMSPMSAEASVVKNYLDWILDIPWKKRSRKPVDLKASREILDEDHYALDRVKERVVEFLAVQKRVTRVKGPILCLVGPPGVGKTSLGRSMARATGREFVRLSLGGVRDEAEIRGHRRTYVGSMPGRIIQSMRRAKTINPLFLLDEVDKMGVDYRGDPAAALLEVLDPEQNKAFNDHYLELDYDLSSALFVTTANTTAVPPALLDRMELIRIPGYTEDEKKVIARRHLIPKARRENGLEEGEWMLSEGALEALIRGYTREAGVRGMEREIASLARKAVRGIEMDGDKGLRITKSNLRRYAGVPRYRHGEAEREALAGVVTGLAWTEAGGELLFVEAATHPGKGRVSATGNLRDVMKESVTAAGVYVRARAEAFGIDEDFMGSRDVHVHVPEGATPKDGPSAGVAMVVAIVSALTGVSARPDVAMTGEMTLRGRVMPVGGLKEKLLAALRGGVKRVLVPSENVRELSEVPEEIKKGLAITPISTVDEALGYVLGGDFRDLETRIGIEGGARAHLVVFV